MERTLRDKIEEKSCSKDNEQISLAWAKDMYLYTLLFFFFFMYSFLKRSNTLKR